MMRSEPGSFVGGLRGPRPISRIEYGQGETIVHLRVPFGFATIITHLLILIFGGAAGLFVALMMVAASGDAAFYMVWLTGWAVGLVFVLLRTLWFLFGREKLVARNSGLTLTRSILFVPWHRHFATNDVGRIRFIPDDPSRSIRINNKRIPQTALAIEIDGRDLKLAHGITEAEVRDISGALKQRLVPTGRRK